MVFLSSHGSTNEVDTTHIQVSAVNTPVSNVSTHDNTANLSDATVYAFSAKQPNESQLVHQDLEQIHEYDLEEMELKWQLALLIMRARRYFQRTDKKITINGSDIAGYDKTKVECFNCHKMGHFTRECRSPRNQESMPRNQDSLRKNVNVEDMSSKAMVAIDEAGFDWSCMADDEVPTNMALISFSNSEVHNSKTCSNTCLKSFETLKTQYDNLRIEFNKSEFDLATYKRGLFAPPTVDLSNFGLEEFQHPEFKRYGPKDSKSVCVDTLNEIKKAPVLTKSGIVPISTARQSSSRAAAPVSVARPINIAAPKPLVNVAKPRQNAFHNSHSLSRRLFYKQTTLKNRNLNNKINTAKVNSVNTTKGNKVTSVVGKPGINDVKSSACWVWRPKIKKGKQHKASFSAGNRTNGNAGSEINSDAGQAGKEKVPDQEYILLPLLNTCSDVPSSHEEVESSPKDDAGKKSTIKPRCVEGDGTFQRTNDEWDFSTPITVNAIGSSFNYLDALHDYSKIPNLEDTGIFDDTYDDRDDGAEVDYNNLETEISVIPIPSTRIHIDHPKEQIIKEVNFAIQTRKMVKQNEAGLFTFINRQRRTNHKDFQNCLFAYFLSQIEPKKVTHALDDESWVEAIQEELLQFKLRNVWTVSSFLYGTIEEEVYVSQPPCFVEPKFLDRVYKVEKALYGLHQSPRAWYETLSTYLMDNGFRRGKIDKTLFIKQIKNDILLVQVVKSVSTLMETRKPLSKDADGTDVDVHLYRFQVQPKVSHMHVVKRIFRYLKGRPTLGLWYPKDLPLELIAYFDSDYAAASLDRKSTT
nr:putative ribonuclease H-like domain-containing protein [Tanacetum cinerariifolium]